MCGITGFISKKVDLDSPVVLRRMAATITHRGPDDEGFFEAGSGDWRVGLAHRRLSIIDLSTGHQPLCNEDGSVWIVFNGEIYNFHELRQQLEEKGHRFATHTDTETIVHAYEEWGEACVERLRGMFAFAIWDTNHQRLFLARDRFGKKPLFLYESDGGLVFASEVKAILAFPGVNAQVDTASVWDYFTYRYVPAPATLFCGIRKLMPGSYAIWESGRLVERRYYRPPVGEPFVTHPLSAHPADGFLEKLDEAVRIRMISDVPFGAFLSGGLDSSAVVGLMSRHSGSAIKTFSVGFDESGYSELDYARTISGLFKTEHHELMISQDHVMEHLPAMIRYRDAPVSEPSDIPIYLLSREARKSVKMVLTGEGADELLGGYPKHVGERYGGFYRALPQAMRRSLLEPLVRALPYRYRRLKTAILSLGIDRFEERMPRWFGALADEERNKLVAMRPTSPRRPVTDIFDSSVENSPLRRVLYFDQTSWLPDNLLERGDSMTMAASLEARMPFMDHELAFLVATYPDRYLVHGQATKWILREAVKKLLPRDVLDRPKVGFRVPVNEWFRTKMRDYLYDHLMGPDSRTCDYYHRVELERVLGEHMRGEQNHEKLIWCLINLEIWHRSYF